MKLYDVMTDTFITDRTKIIDKLTVLAACLLTYSQRKGFGGSLPPEGKALLRAALAPDQAGNGYNRVKIGLVQTVRLIWRADVMVT